MIFQPLLHDPCRNGEGTSMCSAITAQYANAHAREVTITNIRSYLDRGQLLEYADDARRSLELVTVTKIVKVMLARNLLTRKPRLSVCAFKTQPKRGMNRVTVVPRCG